MARSAAVALAVVMVWWLAPAPASGAVTNGPPTTPTLISPASGASVGADAPQLFSIRATDPDGDPYSGWIVIADADGPVTTFPTTPTRSGDVSIGTPTSPLPPGSYTWTAWVGDLPFGLRSGQPAPQPFSVTGSPTLGGGPVTGRVSASPALPAPGFPCTSTNLSVTATSAAAVLTFAPRAFAGFVNFGGGGRSSCHSWLSGAGTLTLSADGLGAAGTSISCPELNGQYLHLAAHFRAVVGGACTVNGTEVDTVNFSFELALTSDGGAGVIEPMSEADLLGHFLVPPAS